LKGYVPQHQSTTELVQLSCRNRHVRPFFFYGTPSHRKYEDTKAFLLYLLAEFQCTMMQKTTKFLTLAALLFSQQGNAYTVHPKKNGVKSSSAQKMLKGDVHIAEGRRRQRRQGSTQLSQSVLASCDTLPSFQTAHGILSPETVSRMDQLASKDDLAVQGFLQTYRTQGPMSCLPMLSDPDVLPHLTRAMRDVI